MSEGLFPSDLLQGYRAFKAGRFEREKQRYETLAEAGQKPVAMVIACCDSRAAPELVFNTGPGGIFVVRNVANLVPPYDPDGTCHAASAALEYAVQVLNVRHIVVMGHSRCGGIAAALDPGFKPLSSGNFIGKWIDPLSPVAAVESTDRMTGAERQTALERISVRNSVNNLRTFPWITILEGRGQISLHGAWFDICGGELWVMEEGGDFIRPQT